MLKTIVFFFVTLVLSSNVFAGLIQYDWNIAGDNSIIYDNNTKLEWLSLHETSGESYYYVESQLGLGGEYSSFRFATIDDVKTLINNAGSRWGWCYSCPAEIPPMENLIKLIGNGYSYSSGISAWGYIESNPSSQFFNGVLMSVDYNADRKMAAETGGFKSRNSYGNLGGFLVRTVDVPEPSTLSLLLISLIGLFKLRNSKYA